MFLTPEEIQQLTGRVRATAQILWLRENGFIFKVNARGDPVVATDEARRKLVGGPAPKKKQEPNWEALNGPSKAA